ncbi:MAG: hypothetical protein [Betatorquevirus homini35]|uniref:DUF755 domain-containing protein n=1 Tax=Anelloviridae sp. TaxID=2055263 RepID=A0A385E4F6_9VIRU|nr:MAG: hypothetical protein QKC64_gp2 [Anelloviridae sp.]AXQ65765.1 MAG: hypothetical protein [Anelloviridae sp.]
MTLAYSQNGPLPITSHQQLKSRILQPHHQQCSTLGIGKKTSLKRKLLNELQTTRQLMKMCSPLQNQVTTQNPFKRKEKKKHQRAKKKRRKRSSSTSSSSSRSSESTSSNSSN